MLIPGQQHSNELMQADAWPQICYDEIARGIDKSFLMAHFLSLALNSLQFKVNKTGPHPYQTTSNRCTLWNRPNSQKTKAPRLSAIDAHFITLLKATTWVTLHWHQLKETDISGTTCIDNADLIRVTENFPYCFLPVQLKLLKAINGWEECEIENLLAGFELNPPEGFDIEYSLKKLLPLDVYHERECWYKQQPSTLSPSTQALDDFCVAVIINNRSHMNTLSERAKQEDLNCDLYQLAKERFTQHGIQRLAERCVKDKPLSYMELNELAVFATSTWRNETGHLQSIFTENISFLRQMQAQLCRVNKMLRKKIHDHLIDSTTSEIVNHAARLIKSFEINRKNLPTHVDSRDPLRLNTHILIEKMRQQARVIFALHDFLNNPTYYYHCSEPSFLDPNALSFLDSYFHKWDSTVLLDVIQAKLAAYAEMLADPNSSASPMTIPLLESLSFNERSFRKILPKLPPFFFRALQKIKKENYWLVDPSKNLKLINNENNLNWENMSVENLYDVAARLFFREIRKCHNTEEKKSKILCLQNALTPIEFSRLSASIFSLSPPQNKAPFLLNHWDYHMANKIKNDTLYHVLQFFRWLLFDFKKYKLALESVPWLVVGCMVLLHLAMITINTYRKSILMFSQVDLHSDSARAENIDIGSIASLSSNYLLLGIFISEFGKQYNRLLQWLMSDTTPQLPPIALESRATKLKKFEILEALKQDLTPLAEYPRALTSQNRQSALQTLESLANPVVYRQPNVSMNVYMVD